MAGSCTEVVSEYSEMCVDVWSAVDSTVWSVSGAGVGVTDGELAET